MKITLIKGDITKVKTEAIVNAANNSLLGGGGVDGAIHRAAGRGLWEECRTLGGCATGSAKITGSYNLGIKAIIHTVGPIYSASPRDAALLKNCYLNSLDLAKANGIHSVAFPGISTGAYRYPLKEATEIAVKTVSEWLSQNADYDMEIVFCCFDEILYQVYQFVMNENGGNV